MTKAAELSAAFMLLLDYLINTITIPRKEEE